MVAVHYIKEPEPIVDLSELRRGERRKRRDDPVKDYSVKQKKYQERGVAAFITAIVTVLLLGLNGLGMYFGYVLSRNSGLIGNVRYVGEILEKTYLALSSVSERLNALSSMGAAILIAAVSLGSFFAYLAVSHARKRGSAE
jgi:hypothetical protein